MRASFPIVLAIGILTSISTAIQVLQHEASPAVVRLVTHRKAVRDPVERDTLRQRQTVTETLDNGVWLLFDTGDLVFSGAHTAMASTSPKCLPAHISDIRWLT